MRMFNQEVYKARREKLKSAMKSGVCIFMGNNEAPMNYPDNCYQFRQDSNFLYFFGIAQAGLKAIIDVDNNRDIIFGDELTVDDIVWMGEVASIKELASRCGVVDVRPAAEFEKYVKSAKAEVHFLPPYRHDNMIFLSSVLGIPIPELQKRSSLPLVKAVVALRNVKEACEIEELKAAAEIGYEMHTTAMKMAKEGVSEHEIYGTIEGISLKHGLLTSFHSIVSKNGQILHNHTHENILHTGDLLLNDSGAQTDMGYASDNTRTFPVGGKFSQRQKDVYQIVRNTINGSIPMMKPGETYQSIHLKACEILAEGLKALGLMKGDMKEAVQQGAHAMFMPHGLGHMMGLDVHDMEDLGQINVGYDEEVQPIKIFGVASLRMGKRLQEGNVLTNEPGIYFVPQLIDIWEREHKFEQFINYAEVDKYRDFGGIRLEDDILITPTGSRIVGDRRIPIEIKDVEDFMK